MANIVMFRHDEGLYQHGYQGESIDKTDCQTAVTCAETLAYIQSLSMTVNENVTRNKFVGDGPGRNSATDLKGNHDATANMSFWVSKDMAQTDAQEGYFLKMPIDGSDTDAANVYTIPDTTNQYGSDYLKVFTIEAGMNKSGNLIPIQLVGCIVNQMTFHAEEATNCLWTYDMMAIEAKVMTTTGFSVGSAAKSTEKPFNWGDVLVSYDAVDGTTTMDGVEMIELIVSNNVGPIRDLANAAAAIMGRSPSMWGLDGDGNGVSRVISGTIRTKMTTATNNGQDWWEQLLGDASGDVLQSETIILKDIVITLSVDATYYIKYTLHDVVVGTLTEEMERGGIKRITVPYTAQACILTMKMHADNTEPTNWAE